MGNWSREQQVCCSCRYWSGGRNIDFTGNFYDAIDLEGRCNGPSNSLRGMMTGEGSWCLAWEAFRGRE